MAGRQQPVVDDESVVVDEQDVDAGLDITVLKGVVEQDNVDVARRLVARETVYSLAAAAVHGHVDAGKLLLHLVGLVADVGHGSVGRGQHIATALALVATREHAHAHHVLEQPHEVFHVGRLARPAHGDVAHGDNGDVESALPQQPQVEEPVAQPHAQPVEPAEGQQPVVDPDEVAFGTHGAGGII